MENNPVNQKLEDDSKEKVTLMIEHRLPWLFVGLLGGLVATVFSSRFDELLKTNIQLVFFIPIIVYMAGAVGMQTETVYVRNLGKANVRFGTYIVKEILMGLFIGGLFGLGIGIFSFLWFGNIQTSMSVGLAMFTTMAVAPIVALVVPTVIRKEHKDPAVGAGPFTTVIQDLISLLVYFSIASLIVLN